MHGQTKIVGCIDLETVYHFQLAVRRLSVHKPQLLGRSLNRARLGHDACTGDASRENEKETRVEAQPFCESLTTRLKRYISALSSHREHSD